jgi:hypothetical protein
VKALGRTNSISLFSLHSAPRKNEGGKLAALNHHGWIRKNLIKYDVHGNGALWW